MVRKEYTVGVFAIACAALSTGCGDVEAVAAPKSPGAFARSGLIEAQAMPEVLAEGPLKSALGTSLCADVSEGSRKAGAQVVTWDCHGGANQLFALQASGAITAYGGALCLDAASGRGRDGDPVVVWQCTGGANQKWELTATGQLKGINGKCIDVSGGKTTRGTSLIIYSCHTGTNQRWAIRAATRQPADAAPPSLQPEPTPPPAVPVAPAGVTIGSAELPRVTLDTRMPAATGRTISVAAGGDLQAALNAAQPGDVVALAAGASFVGNFTLPAKSGVGAGQWITVRSTGTLPAEGTRVGPSNAPQMAKILTPNAISALVTAPGAQGWRLTGVEISATPQAPLVYALVAFGTAGDEQNTVAEIPSRIVLDRSYVHGLSHLNMQRCVALNSASTAIVDSYLADCHSNYSDAQAIVGWNGPGPFKIVNNYLEAGTQMIMFGGADPSVANLIPSDIEIRRNHFTRPLSWKGVWKVKNLLELKAGQRVLVEGNVFENHWVDAQAGFAFVWFSANADGNALWSITQDVTFRLNRVRNVAAGFNLADRYNASLPRMRRVTITDNLITGLDWSNGRLYQILGEVAGVTISRNTGLGVNSDVMFGSGDPLQDFVFRDNVTGGQYTLFSSAGMGARALTALRIPAANVTGNVFVSGSGAGVVPAGNSYVGSTSEVGFVNFEGGDLRLTAASPFRASGTGGVTPGADLAAVATMTNGVVR